MMTTFDRRPPNPEWLAEASERLAVTALVVAITYPCDCDYVHAEPLALSHHMLVSKGFPLLSALN